jgi:hypothetical protein
VAVSSSPAHGWLQVPPIDLDFRHHSKEYYLNAFGYLLEDPEVFLWPSHCIFWSVVHRSCAGPTAAWLHACMLNNPWAHGHDNNLSLQDVEKWRAREANGLNFLFLYLYSIVVGLFYYHVRTLPFCPAVQPSACPAGHTALLGRARRKHVSRSFVRIEMCNMHAQENFLRTLERVFFFFLAPGLTDHWPCDYERKVRCQ